MTVDTTSQAPATAPGQARHPSPSGRTMKKVLAIDDSPEILQIIHQTLDHFGFATLIAEEGLTGIKMTQEHLPDLILCDINMPSLDGYDTLRALREHEATAAIPFIFLSGATDKIAIRKGMELGADDYLTKPFSPKELLAAVNARLEKQADWQRLSDRKLNELRGNLTLALPHELRTPLNGIMGLAHLMMEDYQHMPPEEVLESAQFIHASALRLHHLVENFLAYSQIELMANESKMIEIPDSHKPVATMELVQRLARSIAARHKREGDLLLKSDKIGLRVPSENFAKIVEEILDNAFKFSEPGKPVLVATEAHADQFHFVVADQGRGMTADQIRRIGPHIQFERKTFEQQGAGLGLFIAKRITELLGGQFLIESKPGQGTAVKVSFALPGI